MMRPAIESLHLPNPKALQIGALSALAAFTLQVGRLSSEHLPVNPQAAPATLTEELASGPTYVTPPAPESGQPGQAQETQLERGVPSAIQKYIDHNSAVITTMRCSASLIRNRRGIPIGAMTAAHCIYEDKAMQLHPLVKGSDGNTYMVNNEPIAVQRGIDVVNLQTVGDVSEFIVPPKTSGIDQALAVLAGHRPGQVIKDYRRELLPEGQLSSLPTNETKIWLSGYPYTQDGDSAGNMIRQEFPTTYIGQDVIEIYPATADTPLVIDSVASATDKIDSNGALCSWGLSGGEGLVLEPSANKHRQLVRAIGVFTQFSSFSALQEKGGSMQSISAAQAKADVRYYHSNFPGVTWKGVDGVCNYSTQPIGRVHKPIYPVTSLSEVPGQ